MRFIVFSQKRFIAILNHFKSYQMVFVGIGTGIRLEHGQYVTKEDNLLFSTHTVFIDLLKLWSSVGLLMSSKGCLLGYNIELLRCWNFQAGDTQRKQLDHYETYPQNELMQSHRTTISFHNSNLSLRVFILSPFSIYCLPNHQSHLFPFFLSVSVPIILPHSVFWYSDVARGLHESPGDIKDISLTLLVSFP